MRQTVSLTMETDLDFEEYSRLQAYHWNGLPMGVQFLQGHLDLEAGAELDGDNSPPRPLDMALDRLENETDREEPEEELEETEAPTDDQSLTPQPETSVEDSLPLEKYYCPDHGEVHEGMDLVHKDPDAKVVHIATADGPLCGAVSHQWLRVKSMFGYRYCKRCQWVHYPEAA